MSDLRARLEAWLSTQVDSLGGQFHLVRVSDIRALLAEPAAEDAESPAVPDFGCPECSVAGGHYPLCPAPAADGGEVALAEVLFGHRIVRDAFSPYCACGKWRDKRDDGRGHAAHVAAALADLRRTERAKGAREALLAAAEDRSVALGEFRQWLRARAATEPTTTRPTDGDEAREVGG